MVSIFFTNIFSFDLKLISCYFRKTLINRNISFYFIYSMGYKMVQFLSFSAIANCMQHFSMRPPANVTHKVAIGSLAVPEKSYEMVFTERV